MIFKKDDTELEQINFSKQIAIKYN